MQGVGGGGRYVYLAKVNPDRTLDLLLRATIRDRTSVNQRPNVLELPIGGRTESIETAFQLLRALCAHSPDVVLAEQENVLDFVRRHSLAYVEPVEVSYRDEPRYLSNLDYRVRRLALHTLDLLTDSADIYNLVDDIMRDAPAPPPNTGPNEVILKGQELIERIQGLG